MQFSNFKIPTLYSLQIINGQSFNIGMISEEQKPIFSRKYFDLALVSFSVIFSGKTKIHHNSFENL